MASTLQRKKKLTLAVVGGGPTGVELAGAMVELSQSTLSGDFRYVQPAEVRVVLIEGGDRLLAGMCEASGREAQRALEERGVEIILNRMAREIDERGVHLDDRVVEAETVVWAAGVQASGLTESLDVSKDGAGRIIVNSDCSLPRYANVFAIGDVARFNTDDGPLPGVSPVAMQQGRYVAKKIVRSINGRSTKPFRYSNKGSMAAIGRRQAVADILGRTITGYPAWLAWLFVHLFFLVGFKNRVFVLFQWIGAYVFESRGARLITHRDRTSRFEGTKKGFDVDGAARSA
ncbi:MAG: FAD-dependent oxidoreductase [Myxococcota bacterium]